ncbi:DNA adenine methylase [Leeuwenhoekiella parthenopeia]|uniref:DNA adenine methylase n=1 Tax=Leeuwenhoekiella parthenopeia TaxID=2890320 RepID=A0ABS8GN07_9FLAO|nr:DNA adenine methylase [Leeuwenhoekiella parthenopeia]MCC4211299.1 DNA adenine methylase [Leeuwenhoekiella parthenopeia]
MSETISVVKSEEFKKVPHLLKYMGSKREIIDFVINSIESIDSDSEWLCDLFSGTGVVGGSLKDKYKVHANDVQEYSSIMSNTYLRNLKGQISISCLVEIKEKVLHFVDEFKNKFPYHNFDYSNIDSFSDLELLEKKQQTLINNNFDFGFHLFTKYYSGTYWSYNQCVWIDSIRAVAELYKSKPQYYPILSSLIFAMSYVSQSTGHYAQYRDVTEDNMKDILSYRNRELWPYFQKKFKELIKTVNGNSNEFRVTTLDYTDCLRIIDEGSIIYADPPYQSVHYSRFYHALETLVKYDYPSIKFKGRYREDRHQSPFCKKTTVNKAFKLLFEGAFSKKANLVLSYSDTGMISLDTILNVANNSFTNYKTEVLIKDHVHSNMGRSEQRSQDVKEYIILFKYN